MTQQKVTLEKSKVTKNTVRYDEPGGERETICPAIYLQKSHLNEPFPEQVYITVEWE